MSYFSPKKGNSSKVELDSVVFRVVEDTDKLGACVLNMPNAKRPSHTAQFSILGGQKPGIQTQTESVSFLFLLQ